MRNLKSPLLICFAHTLLIGLANLSGQTLSPVPADSSAAAERPSALEDQPEGWRDLLSAGLGEWKRVPYPNKPLKDPDIWSLDAETKILTCEGTGTHENLFYREPFADGILHVEWRFKKVEGGKGYNSGVFVRSSEDGSIWHQAQVGDRNVGYLFGASPKEGKVERIKIDDGVTQRGKEAGGWNIYEVTCRGRDVTLWINGVITATWHDCQVPKGSVGLEAEGWTIEFKNVKFKELR